MPFFILLADRSRFGIVVIVAVFVVVGACVYSYYRYYVRKNREVFLSNATNDTFYAELRLLDVETLEILQLITAKRIRQHK